MIIGILNTDTIKAEFASKYGQYPIMFASAFHQIDPEIIFKTYEVQSGEYPEDIEECDGYLITGSKVSTYDDLMWVRDLEIFIHALYQKKKKLIGICFGHQIIASTLGGIVAKAAKGWHVGVNEMTYVDSAITLGDKNKSIRLIYNHQDQVQKLPENAELLGSTKNCPIAMFSIGNCILSIQGHIEFDRAYAKDLMVMRQEILGKEKFQAGCKSLEQPTEEAQIIQDILKFLS